MLLTIAVVALIATALLMTLSVRDKDIPQAEPVSQFFHLDERKARIYENLRDLQFEYRLGKLSDEDYQNTKQGLQKELAGVLAETETLKAKLDSQQPSGKTVSAAASVKAAPEKTDPLVCIHCGAKMPKAMKFCGECGKEMSK
jgi:Skp family chaperone for outer membrane proteins